MASLQRVDVDGPRPLGAGILAHAATGAAVAIYANSEASFYPLTQGRGAGVRVCQGDGPGRTGGAANVAFLIGGDGAA